MQDTYILKSSTIVGAAAYMLGKKRKIFAEITAAGGAFYPPGTESFGFWSYL